MSGAPDPSAEWLETDRYGAFASGTVSGERTRRYHALLMAALTPPTGRVVLVNGIEAWLETPAGEVFLSTQRYAPDIVYPEGCRGITGFSPAPWPTWRFAAGVTQEILVGRDTGETVLRWRRGGGGAPLRLVVRPLLSGRDYHALHRRNERMALASDAKDGAVVWRPYPDLPAITVRSNGDFEPKPEWYGNFLYREERARGLDCVEDLASPGLFRFALGDADAVMVLQAGESAPEPALAAAGRIAEAERARRTGRSRLAVAADAYLVDRGQGRTVIAGYPWFTDWGRDTFIAMRGLMLATGRLAEARDILLAWSEAESGGMLPNRFPDAGETPEFNAVDASLWFVVAVHELLGAMSDAGAPADAATRARLAGTVEAVLQAYAAGTRFGIGADADGLLRAGVPGVQLTWMDAKLGDWVVTPRIGKPVEVQALWINALAIGAAGSDRWAEWHRRARAAFAARFVDPATGSLFDMVDVDHVPGRVDRRIRPNQIFAVGGLPFPVLEGAPARRVVDLVEALLLTPLGLRTLSPDHPDYAPHYRGDPRARDGAYHQGTAWPWLMGPFVEAWLRVRGGSAAAQQTARKRFLPALTAHLDSAGLGHVSEVVDGDPPYTPGGCPFQAWSLGELIRIERLLASGRPPAGAQQGNAA